MPMNAQDLALGAPLAGLWRGGGVLLVGHLGGFYRDSITYIIQGIG